MVGFIFLLQQVLYNTLPTPPPTAAPIATPIATLIAAATAAASFLLLLCYYNYYSFKCCYYSYSSTHYYYCSCFYYCYRHCYYRSSYCWNYHTGDTHKIPRNATPKLVIRTQKNSSVSLSCVAQATGVDQAVSPLGLVSSCVFGDVQ